MKLTLECYLPADIVGRLKKEEPWEIPFFGVSTSAKFFHSIHMCNQPFYEMAYGTACVKCKLTVLPRGQDQRNEFVKEGFIDLSKAAIFMPVADRANVFPFDLITFWNYVPRQQPFDKDWILYYLIFELY